MSDWLTNKLTIDNERHAKAFDVCFTHNYHLYVIVNYKLCILSDYKYVFKIHWKRWISFSRREAQSLSMT